MNELDTPLTPTQHRLMAYVDDEMSPAERTAFEQEIAADPDLAAEVATFRSLADMTKSMSLAEPSDQEMRRFWGSFYNRGEWQIGWMLVLGGAGVLVAYGLYVLLQSEEPWIIKVATVSVLLGGGILFWNTLRQKLRTNRFDKYRGVMR